MGKDRVALTDGYSAAANKSSRISGEGENIQGIGKKQIRNAEEFAAGNKGALASQGHNGSQATANGFTAAGNLNKTNADNSTRHLKATAQHEESGAQSQSTESRGVETMATDLQAKVNRTSS